MGIRDEEIKRLEHYAKGLGIKVTWKPYEKGTHVGAEWATDGSEIVIYVRKKMSKTLIILNFLHELGHHLAWVYKGRPGQMKSDDALIKEAEGKSLTKEERRILYKEEVADYKYRELIYNEVGIKIAKHKFLADVDLDHWIYRQFYLTGRYPGYTQVAKKHKEFLKKYKNRKENEKDV